MSNSAVKTRAELERMKLKDVISYADELGKLLVELRTELLDKEVGLVPQLQGQLAVSQQINQYLLKQLGSVERTANSNSQYARKETLEIHGIPESFGEGKQLEDNVLALVNGLFTHTAEGDNPYVTANDEAVEVAAPSVSIDDFHAIHRLKKKDRVIIKFTNRRKAHVVLRQKKKLMDKTFLLKHDIRGKVYLNESMCPAYRYLFFVCKKLKYANHIHRFSFFNGNLRVTKVENGTSELVSHLADLQKITDLSKEDIEQITQN